MVLLCLDGKPEQVPRIVLKAGNIGDAKGCAAFYTRLIVQCIMIIVT